MKLLKLFFVAMVVTGIYTSCSSQNSADQNKEAPVSEDEVTVYYSHFKRRCVTCVAVENISKEAIAELYSDTVSFKAINLDEPGGKEEGERMGISGQSLLIIKGDTKIDLTAEGFMNAVTKPEELKKILQEKIDPLIR